MKILTDIHCHTNVSDHAFCSFDEMVRGAESCGMELIAITNHGPLLGGDGAHQWHFMSIKENTPDELFGVKILKGTEANIMDQSGTLDLDTSTLKGLDIVIASIHSPCLAPASADVITETWLNVIKNPLVDILGHIGRQYDYPFDVDRVVRAAAENSTWIEFNNHSFDANDVSRRNCYAVAKKCMEIGAKVTVSSDAHYHAMIGKYPHVYKMLEELDFPEELIVNRTAKTLMTALYEKKPDLNVTFRI